MKEMSHHSRLISVVPVFTALIIGTSFYYTNAEIKYVTLSRHDPMNLTSSWDQTELAYFKWVTFGVYVAQDYYFFAEATSMSNITIFPKILASDDFRGRMRALIVNKTNGGIDFIVEISDARFSDSMLVTLRKYKTSPFPQFVDYTTSYLVFGPPEECGAGFNTSQLVAGTSFYANVTICASPQPSVYFVYHGIQYPATSMEKNDYANYTFYFVIMKVNEIDANLHYVASNSKGTLNGFVVLREDKITPACSINNGGCEQKCSNASCSCYLGELRSDHRTCTERQFLAFAATKYIGTFNPNVTADGSIGQPYPPIFGIPQVLRLDYNYDAEVFYYVDAISGVLAQINFDGTDQRILKAGLKEPADLAYDWVKNHLYWLEANTSEIFDLDLNSNTDQRRYQISHKGSKLLAMVLIPQECDRLMFWTDMGSFPNIVRSSMDLINPIYIVSSDVKCPHAITIDHENKYIYWVDSCLDRIERCDFQGRHREKVVFGTEFGFGIALLNGYIYWSWRSTDLNSMGVLRYKAGVRELVLSTAFETGHLIVVSKRHQCFTSTTTAVPSIASPGTRSKSSSSAVAIGIAVGVSVAALVLIIAVVYLYRRSRLTKKEVPGIKGHIPLQPTLTHYEPMYQTAPPPYEPAYEEIQRRNYVNDGYNSDLGHVNQMSRLQQQVPNLRQLTAAIDNSHVTIGGGNFQEPGFLRVPAGVSNASAASDGHYEVENPESSPPSPVVSRLSSVSSLSPKPGNEVAPPSLHAVDECNQ